MTWFLQRCKQLVSHSHKPNTRMITKDRILELENPRGTMVTPQTLDQAFPKSSSHPFDDNLCARKTIYKRFPTNTE